MPRGEDVHATVVSGGTPVGVPPGGACPRGNRKRSTAASNRHVHPSTATESALRKGRAWRAEPHQALAWRHDLLTLNAGSDRRRAQGRTIRYTLLHTFAV